VWIRITGRNVIPAISDYFEAARARHRVLTTGMVRLEVMLGAETWSELLELQLLFSTFSEIEPRDVTWDEAGRLAMRMKGRGFHLRAQDLLIASVAIENNLTLVHADRDFEPLAEHEGLKTESLLHLVE
jgi:hypothetical protein